ncbi:membrane protein insertion efficiency factor YidD [Nitrosophilus alvini]|uniref:membrane protein insertion efficiency factor YidD n=1 Tax=Nitrosophilus alvini TaxID=2714855 RepID=UPI00190CF5A6|nr:membrane protein insertion efficiency factor YidD [Nitrosophilus alvini]
MRRVFISLIKIYQRFFSLISPGSCRYYPTCSEYAKWEIETNNPVFAVVAIVLRILRCNQLFPGGIDYPVVYRKIDKISKYNKEMKILYWLVPKKRSKNLFFVIKNFKEFETKDQRQQRV